MERARAWRRQLPAAGNTLPPARINKRAQMLGAVARGIHSGAHWRRGFVLVLVPEPEAKVGGVRSRSPPPRRYQ